MTDMLIVGKEILYSDFTKSNVSRYSFYIIKDGVGVIATGKNTLQLKEGSDDHFSVPIDMKTLNEAQKLLNPTLPESAVLVMHGERIAYIPVNYNNDDDNTWIVEEYAEKCMSDNKNPNKPSSYAIITKETKIIK